MILDFKTQEESVTFKSRKYLLKHRFEQETITVWYRLFNNSYFWYISTNKKVIMDIFKMFDCKKYNIDWFNKFKC